MFGFFILKFLMKLAAFQDIMDSVISITPRLLASVDVSGGDGVGGTFYYLIIGHMFCILP